MIERKESMSLLEKWIQENNKYLLTLDNDPVVYHEGIKQVYALEWMIDK